MSTLDLTSEQKSVFRAYYELTKPNVVFMMLVTAAIGMFLAGGDITLQLVVATHLGIGFCAAGAAVVNHVADRTIDTLMKRTENRPVATGAVPMHKALLFAAALACFGQWLLITQVNVLTALLTLGGLVGYAFIYTLLLKHLTPQNIVIGGLAGAIPPLLGWTAVTNSIEPDALLLVLIIFAWTPPHFWALAIHKKEEYAKAGIPMLPVTHGDQYTARFIVLYTLMLIAASCLPFVTQMCGWLYLASALVLGGVFLFWSIRILQGDQKAPMAAFKYSIFYLLALFVVILVDATL